VLHRHGEDWRDVCKWISAGWGVVCSVKDEEGVVEGWRSPFPLRGDDGVAMRRRPWFGGFVLKAVELKFNGTRGWHKWRCGTAALALKVQNGFLLFLRPMTRTVKIRLPW